jgi:hypothetical protein
VPANAPFAGINAANLVQASGLIARGYSKIVLVPVDLPGGVTDIIQGVQLLGVSATTVQRLQEFHALATALQQAHA